jgi:Rrf2 family protein
MKLTTKSRYGMNAMYELVKSYGQGPVALKVIAEKQQIPESFLEQLMNQLRKADLVISSRGAQGGYELSRPHEDISVGQVLYALEGSIAPVDCLLGDELTCRSGGCAGRILWEKIYEAITKLVDSMSLAELAQEYCNKQEG